MRHRAAHEFLPIAILVSGLAITVFATYFFHRVNDARTQRRFDAAVAEAQERIYTRIESYIALLRGASGLLAVKPDTTRADWKDFVDRLRVSEFYPGVQGIGLTLRLRASETNQALTALRRQGLDDFAIYPAGPRSEYHAIVYLEPLDRRNQAALGYDMFTEPTRRGAMERAWTNGQPAASGKVKLVQEIDGPEQAGFLIYLPVYRGGAIPETAEERRANLNGFVYSPFRADDLFTGIFGTANPLRLGLRVFDGQIEQPAYQLHASIPQTANGDPQHNPRFQRRSQVNVAGQPWTLLFSSTPRFEANTARSITPIIAIFGALVTGALFSFAQRETRSRAAAEKLAAVLRDSEEHHRIIAETAADGILTMDERSTILSINPAGERIFGYRASELIGQPMTMLMPERFREHHRKGVVRFLETGQRAISWNAVELPGLRKDGSEVPLEISFGHSRQTGKSLFIGLVRDITERKRAENALREREARFRAVFNQQFQFMAILAPNGLVLEINELPLRQTGVSRDEAVGRLFWETPWWRGLPQMRIDWPRRLAVAAQSNEPVLSEDSYQTADGKIRVADAAITAVKDSNGAVEFFIVQASDTTDRKRAEKAVLQRESVLRTVANQAGVGLVMVNQERRYVFANQTYVRILRLPEVDIVGKRVSDVLAHVYDQIQPRLDRAFSGERVQYELRLPGKAHDRDDRFYEVVYEPPTADMTDPYVVVVIVDITDRKLAEQRLELAVAERTAQLRETIGELEAFSYSISHDMRAPLRAMQGYSQVLLNDYHQHLDPSGKRYLERINSSAIRLDRLIQDVLSYSRVGRAEVQLEPVNLDRLVDALVNEYPTVRAAELDIATPLGSVLGTEALLSQIISNLLINAAKFVRPGVTPRIRIWSREEGAVNSPVIRLFIQDNGIGIAPRDQQRIFGIFSRVHGDSEYEGTGIGLSIVKKAVERIGGQLGLTSELGQGSTFWLELRKA